MREELRFDGKPLSATLSRKADRWFIAIPVEIERPEPVCESQASVGIDLGVSTALTLSTGAVSYTHLDVYKRQLLSSVWLIKPC